MNPPSQPPTGLVHFLARHIALSVETVEWGRVKLKMGAYLCAEPPPMDYVASARAVVVRGDTILAQKDQTRTHILPGGRLNVGESPADAARREVLEEMGWEMGNPELIGFVHYHHLTPKPEGYPYPYPDFVHVIFVAEAIQYVPSARIRDGFEIESRFLPPKEIRDLGLTLGEKVFLECVLGRQKDKKR